MKIICAYLLAYLGGNTSPSSADLKKILSPVGIEVDDDRLQLFMDQVAGKPLEELIAAGREKLASVPAGGGGAVAVSGGAPSAGGGGAAAEPAKEEKKEEKEESDDDMGFSLFD